MDKMKELEHKLSAGEILNEVRRQQWEMNNTRYRPDATLFVSEDCWNTLLTELPRGVGLDNEARSGSPRCLIGYTTIVVKDLEQYVELKENTGYGGMAGALLGFDEWRL